MSTSASRSITSAACANGIQLNCRFCRVVKWPKPPRPRCGPASARSNLRAISASWRNCALLSSPYGTATRSIGAWRCTYQPFCRRSALNSSSPSCPPRWRSSWSRNCAARARTRWRSKAVYWYIGGSLSVRSACGQGPCRRKRLRGPTLGSRYMLENNREVNCKFTGGIWRRHGARKISRCLPLPGRACRDGDGSFRRRRCLPLAARPCRRPRRRRRPNRRHPHRPRHGRHASAWRWVAARRAASPTSA